jgi:hypothetical protein
MAWTILRSVLVGQCAWKLGWTTNIQGPHCWCTIFRRLESGKLTIFSVIYYF